jgi:hypothetical protein
MEFKIDECHFKNDVGEYLDITVNAEEKYVSVKTADFAGYSFSTEAEIDTFTQELKKLFRHVNGDTTIEIDMRIPYTNC